MNRIVKTFPEGKNKVLTMSYDDGRVEDIRLLEIFRKNGIKGTFHLNSGSYPRQDKPDFSEVPGLYQGMEVSCHTVTHPTIERMTEPHMVLQTINDRIALEKAVGYPVRGMSYPNGSYNKTVEEAMAACGIEYSRTVVSTHSLALPENFMEWHPTMHHNDPQLMEIAKQFVEVVRPQTLYLLYVWGHSYEFGLRDNWNVIEEFCAYVGNRPDQIWYATNIEIVDYLKAWDRLQFAADGSFVYNPNAADMWMTVNNEIVCVKGGTLKVFEE